MSDRKVQTLLKSLGARLKRHKKHLVYELPDGKNIVMSSTPSDFRAENNKIREISRIAGLNGQRGIEGERREKKNRPGRFESKPFGTSMADQLVALKIADPPEVSALKKEVVALQKRLNSCPVCALLAWWRRRK